MVNTQNLIVNGKIYEVIFIRVRKRVKYWDKAWTDVIQCIIQEKGGLIKGNGIAVRHTKDGFNELFGRRIALQKALKFAHRWERKEFWKKIKLD